MKKIIKSNNGYFYFNSIGSSEPMDIRGYDYFFDSRNNGQQQDNVSTTFSIDFDNESSTLKITKDERLFIKKIYRILQINL